MEITNEQKKSVNQLLKGNAVLTEDCGTGKTLIVLTALKRANVSSVIVCPANAVKQWESLAKTLEYDKYNITSWANTPKKDYKDFDILVVDESHRLATNLLSSDRTKKIYFWSKKAKIVWLMSATPSKHRPLDFYTPLKLLNAIHLSRTAFRERYCGATNLKSVNGYPITNKYGRPIIIDQKPTNIDELVGIFNRYSVKNVQRNIKIHKKIYKLNIKNEPKLPKFSETSEYQTKIGELKLKYFIEKKFLKLKSAVYFVHNIAVGKKLSEYLRCPFLSGGLTEQGRTGLIKEGLKKKNIVISLKAGGESINGLEAFNNVVFLQSTFSVKTDEQAYFRIIRGLDDKEIFLYYIITKNEHNELVKKNKAIWLDNV